MFHISQLNKNDIYLLTDKEDLNKVINMIGDNDGEYFIGKKEIFYWKVRNLPETVILLTGLKEVNYQTLKGE